MDTLRIESDFIKKIIIKAIKKKLNSTIGISPEIIFKSPITAENDGNHIKVSINADFLVSIEDLNKFFLK